MLYFQSVRTARFTFTLKELSNADSRALLNIAPEFIEKGRTEFIRRALKEFQWHKGYEQLSLDDLTVQERLLIESTYLSSTLDEPNFVMGNGNYADYLAIDKQYPCSEIELGAIPDDDDIWLMKPLTGLNAEIIEERITAKENPDRVDWILLVMAATLYRKNEDCPDLKADIVAYGDWLESRAETFSNMPVSAINPLISLFFGGLNRLTHLFAINFDSEGIFILPNVQQKNDEQGAEYALIPARFHPFAKIDTFTQKLFGKFNENRQ